MVQIIKFFLSKTRMRTRICARLDSSRQTDMLPSYRTMKYKSPIWGYFHVQKE